MKSRELIVIGMLFVLVIGFTFVMQTRGISEIEQVCFENSCFTVEVAATPQDRAQGLMFREHLDRDAGMLFIFEEAGVYPFWMQNTLIPLDIIWLNAAQEVVFIANAVPCEADPCEVYDPGTEALYVFEVNAGVAEEIGLSLGDRLAFVER